MVTTSIIKHYLIKDRSIARDKKSSFSRTIYKFDDMKPSDWSKYTKQTYSEFVNNELFTTTLPEICSSSVINFVSNNINEILLKSMKKIISQKTVIPTHLSFNIKPKSIRQLISFNRKIQRIYRILSYHNFTNGIFLSCNLWR